MAITTVLGFKGQEIQISTLAPAGEVGGAYYGIKHPMKPHRMRMTNELIVQYGLAEHLDVFVSLLSARPTSLAASK